jgi:hypothetical protein
MENKFSISFDNWVKSIQDFYDYTEGLIRIAEPESEMTFNELISFGAKKGKFIGRLNSKTPNNIQKPFQIEQGILKDGVYELNVGIVPDFYFYHNFNNCSNEFIKKLVLDNIDNPNFKGKVISFNRWIDWLKEKNQKKYINEFSHITDFLEIYSDMTGETKNQNNEPRIKLIWNGPSKVLYDMFAQCLTTYKNGKPYLDHTSEHLADFIKQTFEGFEPNKKTISTEIGKLKTGELNPPKEQTRIKIEE